MEHTEKKKGGGRLKLKGEKTGKKKRIRSENICTDSNNPSSPPAILEETPGSGRIVTSGITIHGFETKFKEELSVGDVIILFHPKQFVDEERIVVAILSQRSLTVNEPFSNDIASTTAYRLRKDSIALEEKATNVLEKGNEIGSEGNDTKKTKLLQDEISRQLQKQLVKTRPVLKYREKTGMWGYKTITEKVKKDTTAEELLDMRSKRQGRDKYCW